jgi:hypothetical protein
MTLLEQLDYFVEHLCNRLFVVEYLDTKIEFSFTEEMFCHLFGIQHCFVSSRRRQYAGASGALKIRSGELSLHKLQVANNKVYKQHVEQKMKRFIDMIETIKLISEMRFFVCDATLFPSGCQLENTRYALVKNLLREYFLFLFKSKHNNSRKIFPISFRYERTLLLMALQEEHTIKSARIILTKNSSK